MLKTQYIDGLETPSTGKGTSDTTFTRRQLQYLEKVFGEAPGTATTTNEQLRFNSGVRAVVHHIRGLTRD